MVTTCLGWIVRAYGRFMNLPIPLVVTALWLAGVALMSVGGVLPLYLVWLTLKGVVAVG
jgi:hypothetical protein